MQLCGCPARLGITSPHGTRGDIFAGSGPLRLVLITCAGSYDPQRGGYQDLAVVTARPAGKAVETSGAP
ncbi:MAG: hypothetical protein M3Q87_01100 [Actinomycetota bacterium]|nr:hypothetical protein [Actinomycetota bacterium]